MITETMFTLGRRYALAGREEQDRIARDALVRMNHWMKREGDDMLMLFSCFMEGARSAECDECLLPIQESGLMERALNR
jgi:hypothetical protein